MINSSKEVSHPNLARHTHTLVCHNDEDDKLNKFDIGYAYTWNNGHIGIKITSDIKCGDTLILKPLRG